MRVHFVNEGHLNRTFNKLEETEEQVGGRQARYWGANSIAKAGVRPTYTHVRCETECFRRTDYHDNLNTFFFKF